MRELDPEPFGMPQIDTEALAESLFDAAGPVCDVAHTKVDELCSFHIADSCTLAGSVESPVVRTWVLLGRESEAKSRKQENWTEACGRWEDRASAWSRLLP